ncbi:class I SAM-dependent methyltransferase [Parvibaculum sp.]|uniref:class I SAM-dependent methyltransferase n=1 Tax=Parvibaculum sp. TaxID=2024848 RepID=UPI001B192566|nr:class I SAM-dependent methyltransferase [Parvibaculum sp.]MBO6667428.1 methyltransferase domain-containing protein [Parvibaculum sp.]MBO6692362.1 methyltransferase domain-containing protein [Parvibaculum sp.]MBO6713980.1 methyltransferase domain-containing protein [Parvibaculum sp.]
MKERCPVCEQHAGFSLGLPMEMPILMNRVYATAEEGRAALRGPLDFISCRKCGFTWNRAFDPSLIRYDGDYENDQSWSPAFRDHMKERAADVVHSTDASERVRYLEIGCGQGRFIEEVVVEAGDRLSSAYGFDPAWRGEDGSGPGGSHIYAQPFGRKTASLLHEAPNVVVSRHTIEHVPDPVAFLASIREGLGRDADAKIWIETPCVSWIFRHRAMQDFFYEHCSLFTEASLEFALEKTGFANVRVRHVFGEQYLWAEADVSDAEILDLPPEQPVQESLEKVMPEFVSRWRNEIERAAETGPVALWGAGAKGVSFSIIVDPGHDLIDHVVDMNPRKQGRFLPGSGLAVVSPELSAIRSPATIFVMNPNYLNEIAATVQQVGLSARLVSVD